MELDDVPQETRERVNEIGAADVVIGLPECDSAETISAATRAVRDAFRSFSPSLKTVLMHRDGIGAGVESAESAGGELDSPLRLLPCPLFGKLTADSLNQSEAYRAVFAVSAKLGARASQVLNSELEGVTAERVHRLAEPILDLNFDLAVPCYSRHRYEGLINSGIISPLTRSLYGKRLQWPMGRDLGFSARLMERWMQPETRATRSSPPDWIVSRAICAGLQVCQVHLGVRFSPPKDATDLSSALARVLGWLFLDMERNAPFWQKVRASQPLRTFGEPELAGEETGAVDVRRMVESFQLGYRNLMEIWGLVLPPATLLDLKKLTRLAPDQFRLPDELWAHIVYDFALGHRLRVISRDHLLRAMTPLYLAWVASYALEVQNAEPRAVEARLERLSAAYEAQKPYVLSRWRWPDRFNP